MARKHGRKEGDQPEPPRTYAEQTRRCAKNGWRITEEVRARGKLRLNVVTSRGPRTLEVKP